MVLSCIVRESLDRALLRSSVAVNRKRPISELRARLVKTTRPLLEAEAWTWMPGPEEKRSNVLTLARPELRDARQRFSVSPDLARKEDPCIVFQVSGTPCAIAPRREKQLSMGGGLV